MQSALRCKYIQLIFNDIKADRGIPDNFTVYLDRFPGSSPGRQIIRIRKHGYASASGCDKFLHSEGMVIADIARQTE